MSLEWRVRVASTGVASPPLLTACDASVVDLSAEPKGSTPRSRGKACWHLDLGKQVEKVDQKVGSAINAWGLLGSGLKGIDRNRRASIHRSHLSFVPLEKLFPGRADILVYRDPTADDDILPHTQRYPGSDPHWKIPVSQWQTVLYRIEQGEPLRKVAGDYHVSYEAVRRVLRAARRKQQAS